jgi:hypothetical protein
MTIPLIHPPLLVQGVAHSLGHLNATYHDMVGKDPGGGDLRVVIRFSTHVFSDRATHRQRRDLQDHSGTWRTFCPDRYAISLLLPQIIQDFVVEDKNAGISQDFNKGSNLILIEPVAGESWAVFFCFEPSPPGVLLTVLSVYAKTGNMYSSKKFNVASYYARKCLFSGKRVP